MIRSRTLALALVPLLLASCGIFKTEEQKRAERTREKPLEVPPDLTQPTIDGRFAVPDPRISTAYSDYSRERAATAQGTPVAAGTAVAGVLPPVANARIERAGEQRWIVAKADPGQAYAIAREFWLDLGFGIAREAPQAGILETNWRDTRAKVEEEGLRGVVSRVLPGMYSTGERDRYRTRIERGTEPGTVEIYVSHRGLEEVFTSQATQDATRWVPRGTGTDRDLEAEMLGRLLVKLGEPSKRAAPATQPAASSPVIAGAAPVAAANAVLQNNGAGPLVVNDAFDRAWRRVGLALDRTGFTVEDRDRTKGVFFVRYIDPEAAPQTTGEGWLDKLAFWKPAPKAPQDPYRVVVTGSAGGTSQVVVQNAKGEPETSPTGRRILALLYEQLK
jgi:outer membrane protein assembly factor BamC